MSFLARRPHFRVELDRKLRRKHAQSEVEETLERLAEEGLVDDLACARAFWEGPLRRKGFGPTRVRHELVRRGAPHEIASQVVDEAFPEGDLEVARLAAERWLTRASGVGDERPDRASLARHLERKGFSAGSIGAIVHDS